MRNGHKQIIQNHSVIARRYRAMANIMWHKAHIGKPTDEDKARYKSLEEQAAEHERKAIFRDSFILIL